MTKLTNIFLKLLRAQISQDDYVFDEPLTLNEDEQKALFSLSKRHDVAHIVAAELKRCGVPLADDVKALFEKERGIACYRYMQLKNEAAALYATLDEAKIRYMVLKGSEIRKHYPSPEMRVSSDIDILVIGEEHSRALRVLSEELEYTVSGNTSYDVSMTAPSGVHVELHHKLTSEDERYDTALSDVWESSALDGSSEYRRLMSPELQLAYNVMHTAKHFHNGGCGVRFLMDLYILERKLCADREKVRDILAKCNLTKFYDELTRLTAACFADGEHTELTLKMQRYILGAGIYGNVENKVAVFHNESGGKLKYALSRIFPKREYLESTYPKLKKCALLYPYYLAKRALRIVFTGRKAAITELKSTATVSNDKTIQLRSMLDELNL